jgi:hypothetical protein
VSHRARSARHLASVLKAESSATWVEVRYHQEHRCYAVHWEGGPTADEMCRLVAAHADEIPDIPVASLVWLRTEPTHSPYGRRSTKGVR